VVNSTVYCDKCGAEIPIEAAKHDSEGHVYCSFDCMYSADSPDYSPEEDYDQGDY
jgi:hypothetical protein